MDYAAIKLRHLLPVPFLCLPVLVSAETVDSSELEYQPWRYYKKATGEVYAALIEAFPCPPK